MRAQGEEARHGERVERLIPGPAGIGDDLGDQAVEVDFPGGGRRLRRRVGSLGFGAQARGLGERGKGLDEIADRERQVEEILVAQRGLDMRDRAPCRLGEPIELRLAEPRDARVVEVSAPPASA